jgi:hypothetical protein
MRNLACQHSNHKSPSLNHFFSKTKIKKLRRARYFVKAPQKTDGLGRIRTGDLSRVKTEDLALAPLFLDRSEVFLDRSADDTTTTNASAPS